MILLRGFMMCNHLQTCLLNALRGTRGSSQMKRRTSRLQNHVSWCRIYSFVQARCLLNLSWRQCQTPQHMRRGIGAIVRNWMRMFIMMC